VPCATNVLRFVDITGFQDARLLQMPQREVAEGEILLSGTATMPKECFHLARDRTSCEDSAALAR
jgi:hypothetical protein